MAGTIDGDLPVNGSQNISQGVADLETRYVTEATSPQLPTHFQNWASDGDRERPQRLRQRHLPHSEAKQTIGAVAFALTHWRR